jgi:hypothetical protein
MIAFAAALALAQPACTPERAVATTIETITAAPDQWLDRCVTVAGIADGILLHSGLEELYRASRFGEDGNWIPANLRHRIGIDRQELRGHPQLRARATRIAVTGVVDSCERRWDRIVAAGGIPFLGGYCHYYKGPTIVVSSYSISDQHYERLVGEAARKEVGNLIEPPPDWQWRDELEEVGRSFAAAVRAGDRQRLRAMLSYGEPLEEERIDEVLSSPAYREMRDGGSGEVRIFTHTVGGRFRPTDDGHVSAYLCYCRTGDCTGRWPISLRDADAGEDRPYLCINAAGWIAPPAQLELHAPEGGGWLAEPRRTALRR